MECREISGELVAYLRDELDPGLRAGVEAHLVECAACRSELEQMRQTLELVRGRLTTLEPSAECRRRLAAMAAEESTASSRRLTLVQAADGKKQEKASGWSRYFGASFMLHAALLAVCASTAVYFGYQWKAGPELRELPVATTHNIRLQAVQTALDFSANKLVQVAAMPRLAAASAVYLSGNMEDGFRSLWAYPVGGGNGNMEEKTFKAELDKAMSRLSGSRPSFARVEIKEGKFELPANLVSSFLVEGQGLIALNFTDRVELWSTGEWQRYRNSFAPEASACLIQEKGQACLPRREEEAV